MRRLRSGKPDMQRRQFITLVGGAVAMWPLAARAQRSAMPVIGFLHAGSPEPNVNLVAAFRNGLGEVGFVEGQNLAIEFRWAAGEDARLQDMAADLVRRRVAVIVTPASTPAALAAKAATTTIPIVFTTGGDPVALGLVASLNRPGGNATGVTFMAVELTAKRLGLLRELVPGAARIFALANPNYAFAETIATNLTAAAATLGLHIEVVHAGTIREIDEAFATMVQGRADALLMTPDAFFTNRRTQIVTLATRHGLPTIFALREFVQAGGLLSYGPDFPGTYRQAGVYTGRVLKGEKPADLPVTQPTRLELVINLATARALGIAFRTRCS
jgi:putative tryptophan/tyrosine transport system substrate-binding protein